MSLSKKSCVAFVMLVVAAGCARDDAQEASASNTLAQVADATVSRTDAAQRETTADPLAGTSASAQCTSYAEAKAGMCSGYYCGVTEERLASAIPADSLCPDPASLCESTILKAVAKCARSTLIANLGTPVESLKPKMEACVFTDAALKETVSPGCLGCFLTAATCAATHCLVQCLNDGPACDACRAKNNCEKPVFECAKIPNPL